MVPERVRHYLLAGIEATPDVLDALLQDVTHPAAYDRRPDPSRFTLREMLAHLADWEGVFLGRLQQTRDEEHATLVGYDEGQWAIDHDYAHADPAECRARFREGRRALAATLRALAPEQWDRKATHTEVGPMTLGDQVALIAGHDGYHLRQTAEWRAVK